MKNIWKIFIFNMFALLWRSYIKKHKPIVIWITWSVWKTTARWIITEVLVQFLPDKKIYTSPKNYNSELGTVFAIFKFEKFNYKLNSLFKVYFIFLKELIFGKKEYDIIVLEYWIDHPWDMDFLLKIVKPDFSVITKIDLVHNEFFEDSSWILKEKMKLLKNTKKAVYINYKDQAIRNQKDEIGVPYMFFNKKTKMDSKYIINNRKILSRLKIWDYTIDTNILWSENYWYIELAMKILWWFWVELKSSYAYINFKIIPWRFNLFNWINNSVLVDSTYNSSPESLLQMAENTRLIRDEIFRNYKIILVIWDMRELWDKAQPEHKRLFNMLKTYWPIISVWPLTKANFWHHLSNFKYSRDAWKYLRKYIEKNKSDRFIILFKWSQNTIFMEEAIKEVLYDKKQEGLLVRQEKFWLERKKSY